MLLSDVCLSFQGPGLLENVEPRVQQSSVTVSDNYRDKKKNHSLKFSSYNNKLKKSSSRDLLLSHTVFVRLPERVLVKHITGNK